MTCINCTSTRSLNVGDRVSPSRWEQVWLGRKLVGTIVSLGSADTIRRNSVKVAWDDGYRDQWWPLNALYHTAVTGGAR